MTPDKYSGQSIRTALYPGTFDCVTFGHLDLIERACRIFDRLVVGVANNSQKKTWFSNEERLRILSECCQEWENVEVISLVGLTVECAKNHEARFIIRGLRAVSDFDFELQLAIMNHQIQPEVETIFLSPAPKYIFLSSTMVKEVWRHGGNVEKFVPEPVLRALASKRGEYPIPSA